MKILLLNEGSTFKFDKYLSLIKSARIIYVLQFTPRQYELKLLNHIKEINPNVELILLNKDDFVDFDQIQKVFVKTVKNFGDNHHLMGTPLRTALKWQELNLWWCSGFVESTILKWDLFLNFYYLTIVSNVLKQDTLVISSIGKDAFHKDLQLFIDSKKGCSLQIVKSERKQIPLFNYIKWMFNFLSSLSLKIWFFFNVRRIKNLHHQNIFLSFYPNQTCIRNETAVCKVYGELPQLLQKQKAFLTFFSPREIFRLRKLKKDLNKFESESLCIIPALSTLSWKQFFIIYFSRTGRKYLNSLFQSNAILRDFQINQINMKYTFKETFTRSLSGQLPRESLIVYYSCKNLAEKKVKAFFTFAEFHSWETAAAQAARDEEVKLIAIQQSAPDPTLTSFYFENNMFTGNVDNYPLPSLLLCAGKMYCEDFKNWTQNAIQEFEVCYIGHLTAKNQSKNLLQPSILKKREGIPADSKICFIPCSLEYDLCEGMINLINEVADIKKNIYFLIKPHPNTCIKSIIQQTQILSRENVRLSETLVTELLLISDYCISTCTSVSLEAMLLKIPQVHIDISALPKRDSLHYAQNIIKDIYKPKELVDFLDFPERYALRNCSPTDFMGDKEINPYNEAIRRISSIEKS